MLDAHGQPRNRYFNASMREARAIEQMLGMVRGILCDGVVTNEEAASLRDWIDQNPDLAVGFPGKQLADRLHQIFADGQIDPEERRDLTLLLEDVIGERAGEQDGRYAGSSALPLTLPAPMLTFRNKTYVATGRFIFGTRKAVETAIVERGGRCEGSVTRRTDVLVIGSTGSRDWVHSSYGTKIEKAVKLRESGTLIEIVAEEHWVAHL